MKSSEMKSDPTMTDDRPLVSPEFIRSSYDFWLKDRPGFRTPFPNAIHKKLKEESLAEFLEWASGLSKGDSEESTEGEIAQMFELILFKRGEALVASKDEQLTIQYPFMPRVGDPVNDHRHGDCHIINRELVELEEGRIFFKVTLRNDQSKKTWTTEFELPG